MDQFYEGYEYTNLDQYVKALEAEIDAACAVQPCGETFDPGAYSCLQNRNVTCLEGKDVGMDLDTRPCSKEGNCSSELKKEIEQKKQILSAAKTALKRKAGPREAAELEERESVR